MKLPEDLRDYRAEDAFSLLSPDTAGYVLICVLAALLILERLGVL